MPLTRTKSDIRTYIDTHLLSGTIKRENDFKHPQFVRMVNSRLALSLEMFDGKLRYFRFKSRWYTDFKYVKGKLYSINKNHKHLHNIELLPITKKEWERDNQPIL